jgi:hypothetical protein
MKKLLLSTSLFLSMFYALAQREATMYTMENIYQSSYINPTAQPMHKLSIGLPGIASMYFGTAFPISGQDAITGNTFSPTLMIENLDDGLFNLTYVNVDLFSLRFRSKKSFFNFSVRARAESNLMIDKDLLSLAWLGNGSFIDNNQSVDLDHMGDEQSAFTEIGFGFSRKFWKKWTLGGKAKALFGVANTHSSSKDASIKFNPNTYEAQLEGKFIINTSSLPNVDSLDNDIEYEDYAKLNTKNFGLGLDLGAKYDVNENLSFSASVIDLGYIKWNDNPQNYSLTSDAVLKGVDAIELILEGADTDSILDAWIDNLEDSVDYTTTNDSYKTSLHTQFYLNGSYKFSKSTKVYATMNMFLWRGLRSSFTIGAHQSLGRWLSISVNNTWHYNRLVNIGVGLMIKPGPFQIYAVADNIFVGSITGYNNGDMPIPDYMTNVNLRVGMNLVFGKIHGEDKIF